MTYTPDLTAGLTEIFFQRIERLTQSNSKSLRIKKRVTEISIELFQNIQKHSISVETSRLTIEKSNSQYSIKAVNPIHSKKVKELAHRIHAINTLSQSELKSLHKKTLCITTLTEKDGAGLGLYKISMRSGSPIVCTFEKINSTTHSFSLEINLINHA